MADNRVKQTWAQIGGQLGALNTNAKLLIGAMMIILALSLILVGQLAATPTMAVLPVPLQGDARTQAVNYLKHHNIDYREEGADILVPVDDKYTVLAALQDGNLISPDQIDFDRLVEQDSPFLSRWQNQRRWLVAKMHVIERTIGQMRGIERATVVIDVPDRPAGIGRSFTPPSASVTVVTDGSPLEQQRVDAIAKAVARAHAGLKVEQVAIIDAVAGRSLYARGDEAMGASNHLDLQLETEKVYKRKLENALAPIPGVIVAVNVVVDSRDVMQKTVGFEDPKLGVTDEQSRTISSTNRRQPPREPGVQPNTGFDLAAASDRTSTYNDERSNVKTVPAFSNTTSEIRDRKGHALQINASIAVPKSYIVGLWRDAQGDAAEEGASPDAAALDAMIAVETARIDAQVIPLIDTGAVDGSRPGVVNVSMYNDVAVAGVFGGGSITNASTGGGFAASVPDGLVRTIVLGGLALLSLAMMFLMVRKAGAREPLPTADDIVGIPPALMEGDSDLVGEVSEAETPMEGIEIDDATQRRDQMLEQINQSAAEQPAELATLLRKWIVAAE